MPLDDLYQQDTDRALDAMSLRPSPPPVATRSAWGAPWRAIKAAAADVVGSTADVLKAYGAASATTLEADPVARAAIDANTLRAGADEGRRQINTGEAMTSATGQAARAYSRELRPDPATASTAEQVVFGVVRPLSKLALGGVVAGPFGLAGAAAEEGLTTSDDLRQQGVDFQTRAAVGAVTAGFTGATAALPLVGPSLKATAGLYVVGGPGAFIAQQAATRAILEQADYQALAQQYDPLDPVGLAVSSLIPLPFAAHGAARNVGRAGAGRQIAADMAGGRAPDGAALPERVGVTPDDVDATLTHNLTLQADQHGAINAAAAGEQMANEVRQVRSSVGSSVFDEFNARGGQGDINESTDIAAKSYAFAKMAEAEGFTVSDPGAKYFTIEKNLGKDADGYDRVVQLNVRVSDHSRVNTGNHFGDSEINIAPDDGFHRDTFSDALWKLRNADVNADGDTTIGGAPKFDFAFTGGKPERIAPADGAPLDQAHLTNTEVAPPAPKADAVQQAVAARAQALEQAAGDMLIRVDDSGNAVTVRDELARIRREVVEGTDNELGTIDADLLRVAAECALSLG